MYLANYHISAHSIHTSAILASPICMYVYTYVCTYVRMYVCKYVCMYVCMYVCIYVCIYHFMIRCRSSWSIFTDSVTFIINNKVPAQASYGTGCREKLN